MVNWSARLPLIVASFVSLAACAALDTEPANRGSVFEAGVFGDLRARQPKPVHASAQGLIAVGGTANGRIYGPEGTSQPGAPASGGNAAGASTDMSDAEAYRLNFEDADVKDVVRAVLGEALKLNYTINPDVTGTITVASAQPVARNDLLATLESVLAAQGFAMVKQGGSYNITSVGVNAGALDVGARTTPGYGVSVVPLRFVSVKTMNSLLGGFVADAEGIRIDSTRNALVISGPGAKRAEVVKTALSFDGDWMAGQSVGIFELKQSSPAAVVKELERIFDAANTANGVIQFQPIDRLKAVLVVSKNTTLIGRAGTWVRRLDGQASSVQQNVFVYRPQYRDASELAKVLSSLFSAGGSAGKPAFSGDTGLSAKMGASTSGSSSSSSSSSTTDTGSNSSNQANSTEAPIDDVTGASSDGTGGGGDTTAKAAPDVIDLTSGQAQNQPNIRISADMANNTVVTYTDQETYKQVLAALQRLDAQPYQVAIQATIAEVTLNDKLEYGVQYYFKDANLGVGMPGAGLAASNLGSGFNFIMGSNSNPNLIVSALNKVTDVEVLSSPSLVVMENQTANLQVGNDVPVEIGTATTDGGTTSTQVEYRSTGIILKVTPRIGDNGSVTMKVAQEISDVTNTTSTLNPTFSKRSVSSQISVVSGQTVVLAGLITTQKSKDRSGLPLLARLPIIGDATSTNSKTGKRSELVVLIKPTIIHSSDDAQTVAEDLRARMWALSGRETKAP
jgi:general secretion pathway protein D